MNFDFYQAFKQYRYTKIWKQREAVNLKSFTLITCKLVILKKLVNNKNLNKKVVFIILILSPTTVVTTEKLGLIGSALWTFIGYKKTVDRQTSQI